MWQMKDLLLLWLMYFIIIDFASCRRIVFPVKIKVAKGFSQDPSSTVC